jgi:hypothetical protein
MPTRRTASLLTISQPEQNHGAGQVRSCYQSLPAPSVKAA